MIEHYLLGLVTIPAIIGVIKLLEILKNKEETE